MSSLRAEDRGDLPTCRVCFVSWKLPRLMPFHKWTRKLIFFWIPLPNQFWLPGIP